MASTKEIILEYVCPGLGVVMATFMFAAPARDLKAAIDKGDLGTLNPTPWGFMLGNCMGWVLYGILLKNMWIFFGNAPGLLISIWLNLGATKLLYHGHHAKEMRESTVAFLEREDPWMLSTCSSNETNSTSSASEEKSTNAEGREDWATIIHRVTSQAAPAPARHEFVLMLVCTIWVVFGTILVFVDALDLDAKVLMIGFATNCFLVFFYGAPLSTIFQVLNERHTASIHIPTMVMNTMCSSFWCAYGFAIGDWFVAVPNGLGAGFGGIQIFLCITFPRSPKGNDEGNDAAENKSISQQSCDLTEKTLTGSSSHSYSRDVESAIDVASA